MNKHILVSLLIISPVFVHGMKSDLSSFISSLRHFSAFWSSSQAHQRMSDLRENKNKFEEYLTEVVPTIASLTKSESHGFLLNCYYNNSYEQGQCATIELYHLDRSPLLLKICQKLTIDGYSTLGVLMIAKGISIERKREFIQQLIKRDFKPTQKDIELAELISYDGIIKQQKTILHFLQANSVYWSALPQEIKAQITQCMIQLLRLLPETSLNNL